jgi:uncharacterized protein
VFFSPTYLLFMLPVMVFSFWAQSRVRGAYAKYSKVPAASGLPGAQAARRLLQSVGLADVEIERTKGRRQLGDHYDPRDRTLRLSAGVHDNASIAALAIAAHEAGHAIQDQVRYPYLALRTSFVPAANVGSRLGGFLLMGGLVLVMLSRSPFGFTIALIGLALYALAFVFTLITLPVEFDASRRALRLLQTSGMLDETELGGAKKVLDAAALTYVAAMATALVSLLYWASLLLGRRD